MAYESRAYEIEYGNCGRGYSQWTADAACPEHGVAAYLRGLLDAPAVAYDPEDPNAPKAGG